MRISTRIVFAWLVAGAATAASCTRFDRFEYSQVHMGVRVRIVVYTDPATAARATRAAFARIAELDAALSDYRAGSEVNRLADRAGESVPVSADLYAVLDLALRVGRASGGAFDPTVGPLSALWRAARESGAAPNPDGLARARALVGAEKVSLDSLARTVRLAPGTRLDLGAVGKGYVLDQALARLQRAGVSRALIEAGGDIVVGDAPPGLPGWRIDVPGATGEVARLAAGLTNAAVATSGDSEQFVVIDGIRYSHVVDPRTGLGLTNGLDATVIASDAALADALATAATVLGMEAGLALIEQFDAVGLVRHHAERPGKITAKTR